MKKLYRKGTVHPTSPISTDFLAFLPAAVWTLTAALSPEDREVLAYLISCSSENSTGNRRSVQRVMSEANLAGSGDHPRSFNCDCFNCYTSYWARWDSSPNRQLIHEIIDAYEEALMTQNKKVKGKKDKRKKGCSDSSRSRGLNELTQIEPSQKKDKMSESETVEAGKGTNSCSNGDGDGDEGKGSVSSFVSFLGERIWSVWT